mmetsp:Transcript_21952/g.64637  ORF Transcript_21952/g.64637 Transcript_21952/m.64637 type:complete len:263 (-) Transcript_21952:10290-11078(-)
MRLSVSAALASFSCTSTPVAFVFWSTSMSSTSSRRLPVEVASLWSKLSSSCFSVFWLLLTSSTSFCFWSSSSARSFCSTRPRSCCSRPSMVTVKLMTVSCAKSSGVKCGLASLEQRNRLNDSEYSHSLSDSWMIRLRPLRWISLLNTGSRTGSMSSVTFSTSRGVPKAIESSRTLRNRFSSRLVTFSWFLASRFLIQPRPCDCGSIIRGHFCERVTMMPFCTESSSVGRPSMVQSPMVPSSTRKVDTRRSSVTGTPRALQSA